MRRDDLIASFEQQVSAIQPETCRLVQNEEALDCFRALVYSLIADGQPTPQVTCMLHHLEVNWLVNNEVVNLTVAAAGWMLFVEDAEHCVVLSLDGDLGEDLDPVDLQRVRGILVWMGNWITHPPPTPPPPRPPA